MSILDLAYARLPIWAQHGAVSAYGAYWYWLRFGPGYSRHLAAYLRREWYTQSQWSVWQKAALCRILRTAADNVPYYRDIWDKEERSAALRGDLAQVPLLDKEPIRKEPEAFLRQDLARPVRPRLIFHTSGSTGTPIATIWTLQELRNSLALREARSARWAGVSFRLPRATFSGRLVEPDPQSNGPYYRYNFIERQVYLSPFHLKPDAAPLYVEALRKHGVLWLTGYAVSYYLLAKFILEQGLEPPRLRAIVTTSEKVTPEMRAVMERAYACRVYEEYSTVENALFASECAYGHLHVSPDAGVVEILRPDGSSCEPGEPGEVVTTCLTRNYQILIRYRLGDVAAWDTNNCPCGRQMPVIKEVFGRTEDVVIGPDGRQLVRFHGIFVNQPNVREGQIIQEALNYIRVRIVPTQGFGTADVADITNRIRQRLGPTVEVAVEPVPEITRTTSGKFRAVVCNIPSGELERVRR